MSKGDLPDWEQVLSAASHLQQLLDDAILVGGGTAAAIYPRHRLSKDADHVLVDLTSHFDDILEKLESVAGWKTARIKRPVLILGSLDGIETGVRQLIRNTPLETTKILVQDTVITIPTLAEMIRIKAVLILKRNATRDYLDFAAMTSELDEQSLCKALMNFDTLYPQPNGESALQQVEIQLSTPLPYDLEETNLMEYKNLVAPWTEWANVETQCKKVANVLFDACNR